MTEQLVNDVIAAGGSLSIPETNRDSQGVDYERRAQAAVRLGMVPTGKRLILNRMSDGFRIDLVDGPEGTDVPLRPVPVPGNVGRSHPVVRVFRDHSGQYPIARATMPRVLRILQGLVVEAEKRGFEVSTEAAGSADPYSPDGPSGRGRGRPVITVGSYSAMVDIREEGLTTRAHWKQQSNRDGYGLGSTGRQPPIGDYEANATGRLTIEIVSGYPRSGRPTRWSDRKKGTVEEKLPELLREVEVLAAERIHQEKEAEREAAERRRAWETAIEEARLRHAEQRSIEALISQVERWHEAQRIRAYCEAVEAAHPQTPETVEWITWARQYADRIDPAESLAARPPTPLPPPKPEELRPFLEGWNPYGPDRHW